MLPVFLVSTLLLVPTPVSTTLIATVTASIATTTIPSKLVLNRPWRTRLTWVILVGACTTLIVLFIQVLGILLGMVLRLLAVHTEKRC